MENFRVGTMDGWGLSYEALQDLNPRLVYCSVTGYGQNGPRKYETGYDFIIQAQGGIMSVTGPAEGPPTKVGVAIADITAGMNAAIAILAALYEREQSGQGQHIDIALFDSQLSWLANVASSYLVSGKRPGRYGNAHPTIVPYELFPGRDGWLAVGVGNDRQWQKLCALGGWADLAADARFATNPDRLANREALIGILTLRFRERDCEDWYAGMLAAGVPCARVNAIDEALAEPQVAAREMLVDLPHPTAGSVRVVGSPLKLSRTLVQYRRPPPLHGQHTEQVLREYLGFGPADIERLRKEGAI
jgi:formyl-CoA transferase